MDNLCFLYIEVDPMSRDAIEVILRRVMRVKDVFIFEDSANLIARIKALPHLPDIILLVIHMEPYSGFQVLDMLRHDDDLKDIKIVALTASVTHDEVEQLKKFEFDGIIGKPISVSSFPQLLERVSAGEPVWHITE